MYVQESDNDEKEQNPQSVPSFPSTLPLTTLAYNEPEALKVPVLTEPVKSDICLMPKTEPVSIAISDSTFMSAHNGQSEIVAVPLDMRVKHESSPELTGVVGHTASRPSLPGAVSTTAGIVMLSSSLSQPSASQAPAAHTASPKATEKLGSPPPAHTKLTLPTSDVLAGSSIAPMSPFTPAYLNTFSPLPYTPTLYPPGLVMPQQLFTGMIPTISPVQPL